MGKSKKVKHIPNGEMLTFIAHFLHFSKTEIYEMSFEEIIYWYKEAVSLHHKMNEIKG